MNLLIQEGRILLYEQTWDIHISGGHPEMIDRYDDVKTTIEDPDRIREGRKPETEELYVKNLALLNIMCNKILSLKAS
ncbi:MAG: hypothetical protein ACO31I_16640, partial [Prochlorotrichaceae cyanobacterium]|jgi:hypothetical protein